MYIAYIDAGTGDNYNLLLDYFYSHGYSTAKCNESRKTFAVKVTSPSVISDIFIELDSKLNAEEGVVISSEEPLEEEDRVTNEDVWSLPDADANTK